MAFQESFEQIQKALKNAKGGDIDGHLAVEIVINDEDNAGIGYVEIADGEVRVEPYDYWGHDARLIGAAADLAAVLSGKIPFDAALADGKIFIQGERALELTQIIRKPAGRKPSTSKPATSKPAGRKPAAKKTAAEPAEKDRPETVKTPSTKGTSRKRAKPVKQDIVSADEP